MYLAFEKFVPSGKAITSQFLYQNKVYWQLLMIATTIPLDTGFLLNIFYACFKHKPFASTITFGVCIETDTFWTCHNFLEINPFFPFQPKKQ